MKLATASGSIRATLCPGLDPIDQMVLSLEKIAEEDFSKAKLNDRKNSSDGGNSETVPLLGESPGKDARDGGHFLVPPWKTCLVLSVSFLFVYTSFEAIQNLQSSLNHDGNLGVWSLSALYASLIIGSVLGPSCLRLLSPKKLLQFGFFAHLCYITTNFYPTFHVLIPMSILLGIGIGGQAISQGLYLASSSDSYVFHNNLEPERLHGVLSMFNGVFYACFKGTHVTGNLISSLLLFTSSYNDTLLEQNICGANVCAWAENTTVISQPEDDVVWTLMGVFIFINLTGLTILSIFLPKLSVDFGDINTEKPSVTRNLTDCVKRVCTVKFLLLMPVFMAQAMVVMTLLTGYTQAFVTCSIGVQWVGYTMISLGVSAAFSSVVVNYITRYVGRVCVFLIGIILDSGIVIVMLLWVPDSSTFKPLLFVLPTVAGLSEGILQPQFNALIASVFPDDLASAYAAFQASKGLAFFICLTMSGMSCLSHELYLAMTLYILGLIGYVVTEIMEKRKQTQSSNDSVASENVYDDVDCGTERELSTSIPTGNKLYAVLSDYNEITLDEVKTEVSFVKSSLKPH